MTIGGRAQLVNTLTPRQVLTITATRMAGVLCYRPSLSATVDTLGVVPWRVCASHYRERLPVSAFLYLYPRLNSYGTASGQHAGQLSIQSSRNCVPHSRPRASGRETIHHRGSTTAATPLVDSARSQRRRSSCPRGIVEIAMSR